MNCAFCFTAILEFHLALKIETTGMATQIGSGSIVLFPPKINVSHAILISLIHLTLLVSSISYLEKLLSTIQKQ